MRQNNQRLIFLDWLRIFSFISVLVGHKFINQLQLLSNKESIHESLRVFLKLSVSLCSGGAAGVVVFFLVSGYIITYVLQTQNSFEFLIKRIFRIYPLYIFAVLLQTVLLNLIEHVPVNLHVLIPQLLLIGDFFHVPLTLNQVE
ncbi:TPA: acyltransferase family protein [Legionella pneumophila]